MLVLRFFEEYISKLHSENHDLRTILFIKKKGKTLTSLWQFYTETDNIHWVHRRLLNMWGTVNLYCVRVLILFLVRYGLLSGHLLANTCSLG